MASRCVQQPATVPDTPSAGQRREEEVEQQQEDPGRNSEQDSDQSSVEQESDVDSEQDTDEDVVEALPPAVSTDWTATLPDELLLLLFRRLSNADRLSVARHVCRRWRDLAATRDAWRHRTLHVGGADLDVRKEVSVARAASSPATAFTVLREAPCLGALRLDAPGRVRTLAPLLRCPVRSLRFERVVSADCDALVALLGRQASSSTSPSLTGTPSPPLREVRLDGLSLRTATQATRLLAALDACRPARLHLRLCAVPEALTGELASSSSTAVPPASTASYLKELTFLVASDKDAPHLHFGAAAALLRHLVTRHAATLQAVRQVDRPPRRGRREVDDDNDNEDDYLEDITLLGRMALRDRPGQLTCPAVDGVPGLLAATLPCLERVELSVERLSRKHWQPTLRLLRRAPRLRHLTILHDGGGGDNAPPVPPRDGNDREVPFSDVLMQLLDAAASGAPKLDSLTIWAPSFADKPKTFWRELWMALSRFPSLCEVRVDAMMDAYTATESVGGLFEGYVDEDSLQFLLGMEGDWPLTELRLRLYCCHIPGGRTLTSHLARFPRLRRIECTTELVDLPSLARCPGLEELRLDVEAESWRRARYFCRVVPARLKRLDLRIRGRWMVETLKAVPTTPNEEIEEAVLQVLESLVVSPSASSSTSSLSLSLESRPALGLGRYWRRLTVVVAGLASLRELRVTGCLQPGSSKGKRNVFAVGLLPPPTLLHAAAATSLRVLRLDLPTLSCVDAVGAEVFDNGSSFVRALGSALGDSALCLVALRAKCECTIILSPSSSPSTSSPSSSSSSISSSLSSSSSTSSSTSSSSSYWDLRSMGRCSLWRALTPRALWDVREGEEFSVCGPRAPSEAVLQGIKPGKWVRL